MKWPVILCLLAPAGWILGQNSMVLDQACGSSKTKFAAHLESLQTAVPKLSVSMSRIVIFPEAISIVTGCYTVVRVGMDGKWLGAACIDSYISLEIAPGEHHLCVNPQKKGRKPQLTALFGFKAEAGQVYYFRAQYIDANPSGMNREMHLEPMNYDEGLFLLGTRKESESQVK